MENPAPVSVGEIRVHLHTAVFGRQLVAEPLLPSTNTAARRLAQDGAP